MPNLESFTDGQRPLLLLSIRCTRGLMTGASRLDYRPDIDGLRAIAVMLVVLFHSNLASWFRGGFIGVDIFFVISGFLITRNLLAEFESNGTISLVDFWARRARRLVPAATIMLLITALLAIVFGCALDWQPLALDVIAATFSLANIRFGKTTGNYFTAHFDSSPLLHTWSLGVEEQFYIFWPVLFLASTKVFHARHLRSLAIAFIIVVATSLSLSSWFTVRGSPWAFYGVPMRAWQLAMGGLVVLSVRGGLTLSKRGSTIASLVGLALVTAATLMIDELTRYPGIAALAPTVGAAAILVGGDKDSSVLSKAMKSRPLQWLGLRSYGLYLWHWPLLAVTALAISVPRAAHTAAALVISMLAAAASYRLVEVPLRTHPKLKRPRNVLALVVISVATAMVAAFALHVAANKSFASESIGPTLKARDDVVRIPGCEQFDVAMTSPKCRFGDTESRHTLLLLGDSHAMHWMPALAIIAKQQGLGLIYSGLSNCPAVDARIAIASKLRIEHPACDVWQSQVMSTILPPSVRHIIVANSAGYRYVFGDEGQILRDGEAREALAVGLERFLVHFKGASPIVLHDTPQFPFDPVACVARRRDTCVASPSQTLNDIWTQLEQEAVSRSGAVGVSTSAFFCKETACSPYDDEGVLYRDRGHLSRAGSVRLAEKLRRALPHLQ